MKTSAWITRLVACTLAAFAAPLLADVGQPKDKDQIANTYVTQPREKLRAEMDTGEQAELSHGDIRSMSSSGASQGDAHGAAGARDAQRTREEVRAELGKSSRTTDAASREEIARPNQKRAKAP